MKKKLAYASFTLVEMLVVILILSILAAAIIPKVIGVQDRAKIVQANQDMKKIEQIVKIIKFDDSTLTLLKITWNACSQCFCRISIPLDSLPSTHQCIIAMTAAINKISIRAGLWSWWLVIFDPRWSPYLLDENEGEVWHTTCIVDKMYSAGKDALLYTDDDIILHFESNRCAKAYEYDG